MNKQPVDEKDPFESRLETEMQRAVSVVDPDVEAALNKVHRSVGHLSDRGGRSRPQFFLALAAAVAILGGGVFAAAQFGQSDPDELLVGDGSTTITEQEGPEDEPSVTSAPVTTSPVTTGPVPTTISDTTTDEGPGTTLADSSTTEVIVEPFKLLDVGLATTDLVSGELILLPFGTPRAEVLEVVVAQIGDPISERPLEQCGRGPTSLIGWGAFSLYVDDGSGTVVGWNLNGSNEGPAVTTGTGIEIGTSVAVLRNARPDAEPIEGSLGWELSEGSIGWFISGPSDTDVVEASWAGESCVFG